MASPQAVTVQEVKDALATIPGITLPSSITDPLITSWIERKTAWVLDARGVDTLPDADTVDRNLIDGAVLDLVVNLAKRRMHPGRDDILRLLNDEQAMIERGIKSVERRNPRHSSAGTSGVSGGVV